MTDVSNFNIRGLSIKMYEFDTPELYCLFKIH